MHGRIDGGWVAQPWATMTDPTNHHTEEPDIRRVCASCGASVVTSTRTCAACGNPLGDDEVVFYHPPPTRVARAVAWCLLALILVVGLVAALVVLQL